MEVRRLAGNVGEHQPEVQAAPETVRAVPDEPEVLYTDLDAPVADQAVCTTLAALQVVLNTLPAAKAVNCRPDD